ncbi:outer membrane beta-barrel protein [Halomonas saccharevitans]|uniref:Outer membrane protein beta-barrel domain-containing protein n=1 Tax=Halomonas saccharevitans TaxID=416872 RepID=A0A1I6XF99_9GAMM|nr:outer membrane beta-barrel protein [Halomonas saccharevitans]SFT37058.1 Outer membrane protein beta-barrel domain-containing protein [Halomonas saccharevitans]
MPRTFFFRPLMAAGLASALALSAAPAMAAGTGFYVGAGAGETHADGDFDDETSHWKLTGGYHFGWLPLIDLGAEVSYVNTGELDGEVGGRSATLEVESVQAMGLAGLSFGPLGLYAKAGMADWDAERRGRGLGDRSGTDPVYGVGARLGLFGLSGRLEYERIDADEINDLDMLTAGVIYTF